jgi:hypothetical protein
MVEKGFEPATCLLFVLDEFAWLNSLYGNCIRYLPVELKKSRQPGYLLCGDPQLSDTASQRLWLYQLSVFNRKARHLRVKISTAVYCEGIFIVYSPS